MGAEFDHSQFYEDVRRGREYIRRYIEKVQENTEKEKINSAKLIADQYKIILAIPEVLDESDDYIELVSCAIVLAQYRLISDNDKEKQLKIEEALEKAAIWWRNEDVLQTSTGVGFLDKIADKIIKTPILGKYKMKLRNSFNIVLRNLEAKTS